MRSATRCRWSPRASRSKRCQPMIPLTSTSSSDLLDAIAVSVVLIASSAYSSELSQSMSVELRSVVLRYSSRSFPLTSSICPEIHCSSLANLSSARLALKDQSWYSDWFSVYFDNALKAPLSHLSRKEGTSRRRRICSSRPQLLDQPFSHTDLFLLSFGVCLQGRHPCFQPRAWVNELLVLLLCQSHSCYGHHHNSSSRAFQRSIGSATILE